MDIGKVYGIFVPGAEKPFYIGQTHRDPVKRKRGHERACAKGSSLKVHRMMRKYGYEFIELATAVDSRWLNALEITLIEQWQTFADNGGANLTTGGGNGLRSAETKARISAYNSQHRKYAPLSENRKQQISLQQKGVAKGPMPESVKNKLSVRAKGRKKPPVSEETRAKLSAANKGKKQSDAHRANNAAAQKARDWRLSEEHKAKLISANTGRKHSEENRARRSESAKMTKRAKLLSSATGQSVEELKCLYSMEEITNRLAELGKLPRREKHARSRQSR